MSRRPSQFFVLLALLLWLPAAALSDEGRRDGTGREQLEDDPPPREPDDPAEDPEEGDPPPAPGGEEPTAPPRTDPPAAPAGEEDGAEDEDEPPAPGEGEPPAPAAPKVERITNTAVSPVPAPAGMVFLEGGRVWIGTDAEDLRGLIAGRPPDLRALFNHETPRHAHFLQPYFISKYEVTNAQFLKFLQDHPVEYDTSSGSLANVDEIASYLVNLGPEEAKNPGQRAWAQLYFANKFDIWTAFAERLKEFQVMGPKGDVDEEATARKFRYEPLPRTLKLRFWKFKPPAYWPDWHPPKGEEDHPVRHVSYNECERFAEWAGMHIPTEQEWEWAARGPQGPMFPWGSDWDHTALLANWGGKITDAAYETQTLPVASRDGRNPDGSAGRDEPLDGDGRSWCGCHHMTGNVAEWTSSWFEPYRGNRQKAHMYMGRWIKIIRGGAAADGEMLALRAACRNFIGGGRDSPPYPDNAFRWAGFRLASYLQSGRDQLGPVVRRAVKGTKITEDLLDLERYVGAVTRNWVEPTAEPENHVSVLGRAHSILIIPFRSLLWGEGEAGMEYMRNAWRKPATFKKFSGIEKHTEGELPEWVFGVLHTDIALEPVQVRKAVKEDPDGKEEGDKRKGRRGRGRTTAPDTEKGRCPPGTYLMGMWFGRLALLDHAKEFVCFVPLQTGVKSHFDVSKVKADESAPTVLAVDALADWADFSFDMALGGKGMEAEMRFQVSGRLPFEIGSLEMAGKWVQENPARELTAKLRAAWDEAEKAGAAHADKKAKDAAPDVSFGEEPDPKKTPKAPPKDKPAETEPSNASK